ncbi:unnamed protein product [Gongylonema pulchrum]|uniref:Ras-GEF domain-containing protein n=1 Tax=Gongylonema pulchrum TaxID=637853 RepID=A0A183DP21_9BILA|nr:unnamed protein product [Gongylonema pulchrum]
MPDPTDYIILQQIQQENELLESQTQVSNVLANLDSMSEKVDFEIPDTLRDSVHQVETFYDDFNPRIKYQELIQKLLQTALLPIFFADSTRMLLRTRILFKFRDRALKYLAVIYKHQAKLLWSSIGAVLPDAIAQ